MIKYLVLGAILLLSGCTATNQVQITEEELYEGKQWQASYADSTDNPALPNVLIIGDSISVPYTKLVRNHLKAKADVWRISGNGKNSAFGLQNLDKWLSVRDYDVIHFNWGLWDIAYRNPQSKNQGRRDKVKGTLTATPEEYRNNMQNIVARLKQTGATLIWAATTPVPPSELGRFEGDEIIYNQIAAKIMHDNDIVINDLHSWALLKLPEIAKAPGDVHFTQEGSVHLSEKVTQAILAVLPNVQKPTKSDSY